MSSSEDVENVHSVHAVSSARSLVDRYNHPLERKSVQAFYLRRSRRPMRTARSPWE
ncbi:hypothetical protein ZHAS_00004201 [Anopheles sinensis]|uniref:Uncharacterized protein n=1 Tax=Anopheles sinensis TaxID=74873 RepID=A0A084VGC3_ANOSI|nr:hypothetical protein ZHAS_00004201 [Anopheles sinensis]